MQFLAAEPSHLGFIPAAKSQCLERLLQAQTVRMTVPTDLDGGRTEIFVIKNLLLIFFFNEHVIGICYSRGFRRA